MASELIESNNKEHGLVCGDATAAVEGQNLQLTFEVSKSCHLASLSLSSAVGG
jgi:hypothetical protein